MAPRSAPRHDGSSEKDDGVDDGPNNDYGKVSNPGKSPSKTCLVNSTEGRRWIVNIPLTVSLPVLVMIDSLAVSLVVPLLHQYYKAAGVSSARQREFLSSLFSSSQIVGGLVLGVLTDAGAISRKNILLLSFAGSAISYAFIAHGGIRELIFSRVLVGLVKQTMTVTTAILAHHTSLEDRSAQMGRLTASTTVAWIIGPSVGALLYKHVDSHAPATLASLLFVVNSCLAAVSLPSNDLTVFQRKECGATSSTKFSSFTSNLKACFSSRLLASTILSLLIFHWVRRATSHSTMASYYEERYGIEPHQRGYISSYQQLLTFAVQSTLVKPLLKSVGGERRAACVGAFLMAGVTFLEIWSNLYMFVGLICPITAVSVAMLGLSLRSLVTQVAPKNSMGSVLAALDVLQNSAGVTVPFYRTFLFTIMGAFSQDDHAAMKGDPNPYLWLTSSGVHWTVAALTLSYLLCGGRNRSKTPAAGEDKKER